MSDDGTMVEIYDVVFKTIRGTGNFAGANEFEEYYEDYEYIEEKVTNNFIEWPYFFQETMIYGIGMFDVTTISESDQIYKTTSKQEFLDEIINRKKKYQELKN